MGEWSRICCAVDFSDTSRLAMAEAADLARQCGAELTLVHVFKPPAASTTDVLAAPVGLAELGTVDLARDLSVWKAEAERVTATAVRTALLVGDPAHELLRHARDRGVDLLVVGTHGRTGLKHLLLGSVAERLVLHAPCPVLVVRRKEPSLAPDRAEVEQYQGTR